MKDPHESLAAAPGDREQRTRRSYAAPRVVVLGDVRTVTLGGSPGAGDSGPVGYNIPGG